MPKKKNKKNSKNKSDPKHQRSIEFAESETQEYAKIFDVSW